MVTPHPSDGLETGKPRAVAAVARIHAAPLFDTVPPALPPNFDLDRVRGMLLGLAVDDARGNTTEARLPSLCRQTHGEIRDYSSVGGRPRSRPAIGSRKISSF